MRGGILVKLTTLAMTAALVLAVSLVAALDRGPAVRAQEEEGPTAIILNSAACFGLFGGDFIGTCANISESGNLGTTGAQLLTQIDNEGNDNGTIEPNELAGLAALNGNHVHQDDGSLMVIVIVEDDNPVEFDTDKGVFVDLDPDPSKTAGHFICDKFGPATTLKLQDDCDGDGVQHYGAVIAHYSAAGAELGDGLITAWDYQNGKQLASLPIQIVGEPDNVTAGAFETTVNGGLLDYNEDGNRDAKDCPLPGDSAGFLEALNNPYKTVVIGRVTDSSGQNIGGAWIKWTVEDEDAAVIALPETPTLDLGSFGIGAPQVLCGLNGPTDVKLKVELVHGPLGINLDPGAQSEESEGDFHILGVAKNVTLTAAPVSVACDGTASSTVSAQLTDENGDNVGNNYEVRFDVSVLGTTNPIKGKTTDGKAKTTVTPLANVTTGVPVIVSVHSPTLDVFELADQDTLDNDGDGTTNEPGEMKNTGRTRPNPDYIETSILVQCGAAPAGQPAGPGGTTGPGGAPGGVISGPDTGSGGSLGNVDGRGALPLWPAMALLAGAMALIGGRFALRRTE